MASSNEETSAVTYEELMQLEDDSQQIEEELIKTEYKLRSPYYAKRQKLIEKIPHFWSLVFEAAPREVDQYIQPSDAHVFAEALESLEVTRFEIGDPKGSPKSIAIKFGFKENEWFEDTVLEKKFWYKKGQEDWQGLVSEPVKINWKKGKDLTSGITDIQYDIFQASKKSDKDEKEGAELKKKLEEAKQMQESQENGLSFFAWLGFEHDSNYKPLDAANSDAKKDEDEDEMDDADFDVDFSAGEELAMLLAEDIWPSAIRYFIQAQEQDDEELSDLDEELEDDEIDEEIDIRSLVNGKRKKGEDSGVSKKRKT